MKYQIMLLISYILIFGGLQAAYASDQNTKQDFDELPNVEKGLSDFDSRIEKKLAQMENSFLEKLISIKTFYKKKLDKMENKLSENEKLQASKEIFYNNKLAEVKKSCNNIEKKLDLTQKMNEHVLDRVEKRLNNIEIRLIEAEYSTEHKADGEEPNAFHTNEINVSVVYKPVEKSFTEIEQNHRIEKLEGAINVKAEKTEIESKSVIPNSGEEHGENVSTQEIVEDDMNGSDIETFNVNERTSNDAVQTSMSRRLTPSGTSRIAFTAYLSITISELGKEHLIPFDQVILNEGNAFDNVLHVFICPVDGVYMFQSAVMSAYQDSIQTEIVKDGVALVLMYSGGATGSQGHDQGFNSVIIRCNQGERLWVRVREHYGTNLFGYRFTTFSGYLLWQI